MNFFVRRLLFVIPTLIAVSFISFLVITIPPGDFVDHLAQLAAQHGDLMTPAEKEALRHTYGLDQPVLVQYASWIGGILLHGDFGYSFTWKLPVAELIWQKLGLTALLSIFSLAFIWLDRHPDRHLLGRAAIFVRAITPSRCSASSASPCPTSCWRWR